MRLLETLRQEVKSYLPSPSSNLNHLLHSLVQQHSKAIYRAPLRLQEELRGLGVGESDIL